jgi:hypothetical protein
LVDRPENEGEMSVFRVRDCAQIILATGERAFTLDDLAERLRHVEAGSIFVHFWGRLLATQMDEPEYINDFASWAFRDLHDKMVAEQLSVVDPDDFNDIEELRHELIDIIESRLYESEDAKWKRAEHPFQFLQSQLIVLPDHRYVEDPHELGSVIRSLSAGSIFYHFIDARRRTNYGQDDFSLWISDLPGDYSKLLMEIQKIDPYFSSLREIRTLLADVCDGHFGEEAS